MPVKDIATRDHWDATYARDDRVPAFGDTRPHRVLYDFMARQLAPSEGQQLVELGAGNTAYLPDFARILGYQVAGLDYSRRGVELAQRNLRASGIGGEIIEGDLFDPPDAWEGRFDVVFTMGLVEHFDDTAAVVGACSRYLRKGGRMLTVIPNMRGLNGLGARFLSRDLYDRHVPMSPGQLEGAHRRAGLEIAYAGYLVAVNAWVSNPGASPSRWRRMAYQPFLALTRLIWWLEDHGLRLPAHSLLSPWVVVVAQA